MTAENALHHDLRLLSTRFVRGRAGNTKTLKLFATYQTNDGMMVGGQPDTNKAKEQVLYGTLALEGLLYTQRRDVVWRFQYAFDSFKMDLATAPSISPGLSMCIAWGSRVTCSPLSTPVWMLGIMGSRPTRIGTGGLTQARR